LPVMLQQTDIVCHPVAALTDGAQRVQNPRILIRFNTRGYGII
jgi:hypothetical protein